jgi:hypothetical protein
MTTLERSTLADSDLAAFGRRSLLPFISIWMKSKLLLFISLACV